MFSNFFSVNRPVYEIKWKNTVQPDRSMRISHWIPNATNTHPEYVILISFPLQQWLHGRSPMLSYTYIACVAYCAGFIEEFLYQL